MNHSTHELREPRLKILRTQEIPIDEDLDKKLTYLKFKLILSDRSLLNDLFLRMKLIINIKS